MLAYLMPDLVFHTRLLTFLYDKDLSVIVTVSPHALECLGAQSVLIKTLIVKCKETAITQLTEYTNIGVKWELTFENDFSKSHILCQSYFEHFKLMICLEQAKAIIQFRYLTSI